MTEPLRQQIARLRELAPRLNTVTDRATKLVQMVEKLLNEELSLGISCSVIVSCDSDRDGDSSTISLEYGRLEGKFRLYISDVTEMHYGDHISTTNTPWSSCARDLKLTSFQKIPDLLADLTQKVEKAIQQTEGAGRTIQELLNAIAEPQVETTRDAEGKR